MLALTPCRSGGRSVRSRGRRRSDVVTSTVSTRSRASTSPEPPKIHDRADPLVAHVVLPCPSVRDREPPHTFINMVMNQNTILVMYAMLLRATGGMMQDTDARHGAGEHVSAESKLAAARIAQSPHPAGSSTPPRVLRRLRPRIGTIARMPNRRVAVATVYQHFVGKDDLTWPSSNAPWNTTNATCSPSTTPNSPSAKLIDPPGLPALLPRISPTFRVIALRPPGQRRIHDSPIGDDGRTVDE